MTRRSIAMTLILTAMAMPAAAQSQPTSPTVTTEGRASIKVTPDIAYLSVSIETRAAKPADAQKTAAATTDNVRAGIRRAGVKDDLVKTRSYSVDPQMQYNEGKSTLIGYIARHSLEVRVDNLESLGAIIDAAGAAGATSVSDIRYDTKQRAQIESEALALAVKDGLKRAQTMAGAAERTVLSVWRIDDQIASNGNPRPMPYMVAAAPRVGQETSIAPAELEISAAVTVTVILR